MLRRLWCCVLMLTATSAVAQQTIYWKKDHVYVGGKEVAAMTPAAADQTAPAAPSGLSSSELAATSVRLSWSASTDTGGSSLAGYKIYRGLLPVGTAGPTMLTFVDQPLRPSTNYTYGIVAFDNAQNYSASSGISITTPAANDTSAPSTPVSLVGYLTGRTSVRLQWSMAVDSGGSALAGYRVYRDGNLISGATPIDSLRFDDTGLAYRTTYSYTVTAVDNASNASAPTGATNLTTDREVIFEDNFNRADNSHMGTAAWSGYLNPYFRILNDRAYASITAGPEYTSRWRSVFHSDQTNFKATVTVLQPGNGAGIVFFKRYVNYRWAGYRAFLTPGGLLYLYYCDDLESVPDIQGGNWIANAYGVGSTGTLSVETNTTSGNVKIYFNGVLRIDTSISPSTMNGSVGITGNVNYSTYPQATVALDNFLLERN